MDDGGLMWWTTVGAEEMFREAQKMTEFHATAVVDGEEQDVLATYDLDGIEPIGLAVWGGYEYMEDVTERISADEYDRLHSMAEQKAAEDWRDAADYVGAEA